MQIYNYKCLLQVPFHLFLFVVNISDEVTINLYVSVNVHISHLCICMRACFTFIVLNMRACVCACAHVCVCGYVRVRVCIFFCFVYLISWFISISAHIFANQNYQTIKFIYFLHKKRRDLWDCMLLASSTHKIYNKTKMHRIQKCWQFWIMPTNTTFKNEYDLTKCHNVPKQIKKIGLI